MNTNKPEVVLPEDLRLLIVCDTQFGWNGQTTLKVEELERLAAHGWLKEGIDYYEYEVTEAGRKLINDTLTRPAAGEFVIVPREPTDEMFDAVESYFEGAPGVPPWTQFCKAWGAMLSAAPQQSGQGVVGNPYRCDYCGADYGARACCDMRYEYLRKFGENILPPLSAQQPAEAVAGEFHECPHCKGWSRTSPPAIDLGQFRGHIQTSKDLIAGVKHLVPAVRQAYRELDVALALIGNGGERANG